MIKALFKALASLKDPHFWKIIILSGLITSGLFIPLITGTWAWIEQADMSQIWIIGPLLSWVGGAFVMVFSYFLFPLMFPIITTLFLDHVASHMEKTSYNATDVKHPPLTKTLPAAIKFVFTALGLNILCLPLYLIPVVNIVIYYLLNGYLLGREYFEMISLRYNPRKETETLRKQHKATIRNTGIILTLLFTTPFINLIAPIFATIIMVHLYYSLTKQ